MKILDDTKVVATPEAIKLIEKLKEKYGPDLLFHQSGGVAMEVHQCVIYNLNTLLVITTLN